MLNVMVRAVETTTVPTATARKAGETPPPPATMMLCPFWRVNPADVFVKLAAAGTAVAGSRVAKLEASVIPEPVELTSLRSVQLTGGVYDWAPRSEAAEATVNRRSMSSGPNVVFAGVECDVPGLVAVVEIQCGVGTAEVVPEVMEMRSPVSGSKTMTPSWLASNPEIPAVGSRITNPSGADNWTRRLSVESRRRSPESGSSWAWAAPGSPMNQRVGSR